MTFTIYHFWMTLTFVMGYFLITIEHVTKINKTAIALLMAILCWVFQFAQPLTTYESNLHALLEHLSSASQIIFFLLCALTIVEIINVHHGFAFLSDQIRIRSRRTFIWVIGLLAFFLSSVLDNLTTTIIMITLLQKIIQDWEERALMGGLVVIAANAGGAWTPIGDVTTTMLWIGGQLSTLEVMRVLFIPSLACLVASLFCFYKDLKGNISFPPPSKEQKREPLGILIFWLGVGSLIFVPFFKIMTGLPPFMAAIFGLGGMWLITDLLHKEEGRHHLRVPHVLANIDISIVLFFLGILLAVSALHTAGLLAALAQGMDRLIGSPEIVAVAVGLASAIVDNVPLVAAVMGMYDLSQFPIDSCFWQLIAYCAGTGGSILIIGSTAGVAFMGLEKIHFFWYLRHIGWAALIGYFVGIGVFMLLRLC